MPPTLTDTRTLKPPLVTLDEEERRAVKNLVTKTDDPVDNYFSERQQVLLREILRNSWTPTGPGGRRPFVACMNVGIFENTVTPPLVPDFFVSIDADPPDDDDYNRAYYLWELGAPEVVVEIVSNKKGNELGGKMLTYARWGIPNYVVMDPFRKVGRDLVQVFKLRGGRYERTDDWFFPEVGLGVKVWRGVSDGMVSNYLRWCDEAGTLLGTGPENTAAEAAQKKAEAKLRREESARATREAAFRRAETARADAEAAKAEELRRERDQLIATLRRLGIEPTEPAG